MNHKSKDRGFMVLRYCLACSVISSVGRVLPQAIMFHLTSSLDLGGDPLLPEAVAAPPGVTPLSEPDPALPDAPPQLSIPAAPESSGNPVSFKSCGGENSIDASLVP